jgi:hypothetical protein
MKVSKLNTKTNDKTMAKLQARKINGRARDAADRPRPIMI